MEDMNQDLLKRLQANGIDALPWERVDHYEERWEVTAGCVKLQAVARDDEGEPYGCKLFRLEEGFWEHVGGKALGWDDAPYHAFVDELEEKFWPAYRMHEAKHRNLPRLSHLPDDLRAVAEEFLDLHECWDTGFEAVRDRKRIGSPSHTQPLSGVLIGSILMWDDNSWRASFAYSDSMFRGHWKRNPWDKKMWAIQFVYKNNEVTGRFFYEMAGPIRRSHDFAEFVRRFAE